MKKSLTQIMDLQPKEILALMNDAFKYKKKLKNGLHKENVLKGKSVAMIFEKPSLRTKVAFEVATTYLGGTPIFLTSEQIFSSGNYEKGRESVTDIAKNLERFTDLILARVYSHETIQALEGSLSKPLINALCDVHHPTQALADLMAIIWHKNKYQGLKVAFIGDGNNVATSLMQICAIMGINFAIASPKGYEVLAAEKAKAMKAAKKSGAVMEFVSDPVKAVKDADIVYTDTFVSMGQEEEKAKRLKAFEGYQVNMELMKRAKVDANFMHCLPAHRGEEVTDEVMDAPFSIVFDQAECRLHIAKALLTFYLNS